MEAPKKTRTARTRKGKPLPDTVGAPPEAAAPTNAGPTVIALPADLRIGAAAEVYRQLQAADRANALAIDASAVAKVDAAGLQAVLAGLLARREAGPWTWVSPGEPFVRAVRFLGLQQDLALPS